MADQNKKKYIKYEDTTYELVDGEARERIAVLEQQGGGGGGSGTVRSVNNVQPDANGNVNLSASDVHALPDSTVIPTVPQMAAQTNMSDWATGKTVDAATLKERFTAEFEVHTALNSDIEDLQAEKYTKPSGGIPASDLAADVQTSLGKADTALQQHQSLANYQTKSITDTGGYYTADTVEGALQEIGAAVEDYFDEHPVSGEGWTDEMKTALLDCFRSVAWLNDNDFSDKYTALENALYPDTPTPPSYLTGYTTVGNPTIDSNYRMTTSDGNFIKTSFNFDNGGASWELRGKVNFTNTNQPSGDAKWYDIANFVDANNASTRGLLVELSRSVDASTTQFLNRFNLFASSTSASWNIVNPQSESIQVTSLIDGDFYFKAGWTGSAYYIAASADGVTWSNELRHEWTGKTTSIMTGYPIAFGNKRNSAWGYCIYIDSLELDIDGSLYWKAVE